MSTNPDQVPPLAPWTEDVAGTERRFAPFAHGSAPDPDQAGVRAMNAAAAREAVEYVGTWPRRLAIPAGVVIAFAVSASLSWLGSGHPTIDGPALILGLGFLAGLAADRLVRQRCIWRHRGYAARNALLTLGRCGACGFPLRGAVRRVGVNPSEPIDLCQCGECGSLWPALASEHPRRSDTGERTDLPEVTGLDALRARMRLMRALRARPDDFLLDDAGEPHYIAHMDGSHRVGVRAFIRELIDLASVGVVGFAATVVVLVPVLGCSGACIGQAIGAVLVSNPRDPAQTTLAAGVESAAVLVAVLVGARKLGCRVARWHRRWQSDRFLASHTCPVCTMDLPAPCRGRRLSQCSCCGSSWRARNQALSGA